jgi:ATPase family associated with various cellular activities (AAA)
MLGGLRGDSHDANWLRARADTGRLDLLECVILYSCLVQSIATSNPSRKDSRGTLSFGGNATAGVEQGNQRAFMQLLGLSQAALMPQALTFDIPITMLLKGPRGIGKVTTAVQVARRLGMHVFEVGLMGCVCVYAECTHTSQVNCYDFLGDNDTKTEGLLRARFEQATSCSPCILMMRHLEAFTQTTQHAEPGKGKSAMYCIGVLSFFNCFRSRYRQCDQGIIPGSLWFMEVDGISNPRVWNNDCPGSRSPEPRVLL